MRGTQVAEENFLHNLLLFGRLLRGLGLDISPGRMMDLIHGLDYIDIGRKPDFYHAARTLLLHDYEDIPLFDQAFELFWQKPQEEWLPAEFMGKLSGRRPEKLVVPPPLSLPAGAENGRDGSDPAEEITVIQVTRTYSDRELLRRKDFSQMTPAELEAARQWIQGLAFRLGERRTRRYHPGQGQRLDLRRTLRLSYQTGGEVLAWARRYVRDGTDPAKAVQQLVKRYGGE